MMAGKKNYVVSRGAMRNSSEVANRVRLDGFKENSP